MSEPITKVADVVRELGALPVPVGSAAKEPKPIAYARKVTEADLLLAHRLEKQRAAEWPWDMWCRICHIRPTSHRTEAEALEAADQHVKLYHAPQDEVHKLMTAGGLAEFERLRKRVAELEAERHSTNEALDDAVKALREREARLAVSDGRVPFEYVDAHDHRIIINNKTTDARDQPYAWFQAEDLAIGGAMVNVWLPVAELERLDAALAARAGFEFTDHTGDAIAVAPAAEDWTVFTFTRCPDDEDDQEPTTVRVVVLTARVPQLRAALNLLRAETGER